MQITRFVWMYVFLCVGRADADAAASNASFRRVYYEELKKCFTLGGYRTFKMCDMMESYYWVGRPLIFFPKEMQQQ